MSGRVRVYIATSLDGFIAGEHDDLSWLPQPDPEHADDHGYAAFMASVGALLMGRRTYEVVRGFGAWPYERPVLVASTRPLAQPMPTGARAVRGDIHAMIEEALEAAAGRDVYLDGGTLIRAALDAGLIDELIVTIVPAILGRGIPLFAGAAQRHNLQLQSSTAYRSGLVQLRYCPTDPV
jgi:dihydrofolate reductase